MKTTCSIVLLSAALSVFGQQNLFEQVSPGSPAPEPPHSTETSLLNLLAYSSGNASNSRDSVPPVILQFTGADPTVLTKMEEDLSVMTRLTEKSLVRSLGENSPDYKMGIPMLVTASGRSVRALYLEGFGAVFMIKVNFPVLAPPTVEEKKPERTAEDSEWERTRKELLGIHEPRDGSTWVGAAVPYDAALLEALKKELLETLKNASNIRGLKSEESICVTVFGSPNITFGKRTTGPLPGQPGQPVPPKTPARRDTKSSSDAPAIATPYAGNYSSRPAGQGTVLTLRVKKSDVDAFANGKLEFKAFEKKATFNTYLGSGYDVTSVNSWSRPSISYGS